MHFLILVYYGYYYYPWTGPLDWIGIMLYVLLYGINIALNAQHVSLHVYFHRYLTI